MKQLENKAIPRILTLLLVVAQTACGSKDDNKLTDNSAISDCLGVTIPSPQSATLTTCTDATVGKRAVI